MKRRQFILSSLGFLGIFALSRTACALQPGPAAPILSPDCPGFELSRLFPNPAHARAIGHSYLARYPGKSDRSVILAELDLPSPEARPLNRVALMEWFNQAQQRDFSQGNTVIVNNWVLSRTEADLCALVTLS